jgi:hypothetical protein
VRLRDLLDERLEALRAALVETDHIENDWDANSAGAKFIVGFGASIAKAAAEYIEANREALLEQTRKSSAKGAGQTADQSVDNEVTIENRP